MPRAIAVPLRQEMIERHRDRHESLASIAHTLNLSESGVRKLWRQYEAQGEAGLVPRYDRCGPPETAFSRRVYRGALTLKRRHPAWGAGYIRVCIAEKWPEERLPAERTVQRWFQIKGLNRSHSLSPPQERSGARQPHEVWQMDATEQVKLAGEDRASWLACVDEATGAVLATPVFPPRSLVERFGECGSDQPDRDVSPLGSASTLARG